MKPSLKCAQTMKRIGLAIRWSESQLAEFVAEETGCDGLREINTELLTALKRCPMRSELAGLNHEWWHNEAEPAIAKAEEMMPS